MNDGQGQYPELAVDGVPLGDELGHAGRAQLLALKRHWRLIEQPGARPYALPAVQAPIERLYRGLDRRLFGRGRWRLGTDAANESSPRPARNAARWRLVWRRDAALPTDDDGLCVEYDGQPMSELEQAVRNRLGHPGGTVGAKVWLLAAARPPRLLMAGWLRLDHRSLHRSVLLCAAKLPDLLRAAMVRLGRPAAGCTSHEVEPTAARSAAWQLRRLAATALKWLLWIEQWQLELGRFAGSMREPGATLSVVRPPASAFWADPFFLRQGQRTWVLFEELPFATQRGHICAVEVDASGAALSAPRTVLREPWHLSYPFVWHEAGRDFMLPEAGRSRALTLYEVDAESMQWRRRATLLSGVRLADATVVAYAGRLWMFATCADDGVATMDDTLHVYWAHRIDGPWHAHALNPVKIDARSARPAGSMWVDDGVLYRVAQDCSSTYGGRIECMRVLRLSEDEFEEEPVTGWPPHMEHNDPWHTFNTLGPLTVTDRLVRLPRWRRR